MTRHSLQGTTPALTPRASRPQEQRAPTGGGSQVRREWMKWGPPSGEEESHGTGGEMEGGRSLGLWRRSSRKRRRSNEMSDWRHGAKGEREAAVRYLQLPLTLTLTLTFTLARLLPVRLLAFFLTMKADKSTYNTPRLGSGERERDTGTPLSLSPCQTD